MSARLHFDDPVLDAQLLRALAGTAYGGADLGECLATARRITRSDAGLWYDEWLATAERCEALAEQSAESGHPVSARAAWLRASTYHRTAGVFLVGPDGRYRESLRRQTLAFRRAAALFDVPPVAVRIPYEDTELPGYFFAQPGCTDDAPCSLVVVNDGDEGTSEELYLTAGAAALERGHQVLAFSGPGQGAVRVTHGLPLRPDWEAVATPVLDHALNLPGVDPDRVVLMGYGLGGYLAPRAATAEHRLAACVSDCGPYDLRTAVVDALPGSLARRWAQGDRTVEQSLRTQLRTLAAEPASGWDLRRGAWSLGVEDPLGYVELAGDYSLRGLADRITCPTFVCTTEGDTMSARAEELAAELRAPHVFVRFDTADGVSGHRGTTGRARLHARVFDWLDDVLAIRGHRV